jgi:hypothetical protein
MVREHGANAKALTETLKEAKRAANPKASALKRMAGKGTATPRMNDASAAAEAEKSGEPGIHKQAAYYHELAASRADAVGAGARADEHRKSAAMHKEASEKAKSEGITDRRADAAPRLEKDLKTMEHDEAYKHAAEKAAAYDKSAREAHGTSATKEGVVQNKLGAKAHALAAKYAPDDAKKAMHGEAANMHTRDVGRAQMLFAAKSGKVTADMPFGHVQEAQKYQKMMAQGRAGPASKATLALDKLVAERLAAGGTRSKGEFQAPGIREKLKSGEYSKPVGALGNAIHEQEVAAKRSDPPEPRMPRSAKEATAGLIAYERQQRAAHTPESAVKAGLHPVVASKDAETATQRAKLSESIGRADGTSKGVEKKIALAHKEAGERHLVAAAAHEAQTGTGIGTKGAANYHRSEAAEHARSAGGEWDESKHPRDKGGKFGGG